MGMKKEFCARTNVILHDYNCLRQFLRRTTSTYPSWYSKNSTKFKKRQRTDQLQRREFVRQIDELN